MITDNSGVTVELGYAEYDETKIPPQIKDGLLLRKTGDGSIYMVSTVNSAGERVAKINEWLLDLGWEPKVVGLPQVDCRLCRYCVCSELTYKCRLDIYGDDPCSAGNKYIHQATIQLWKKT